jgi:hypothetical protein
VVITEKIDHISRLPLAKVERLIASIQAKDGDEDVAKIVLAKDTTIIR